MSQPRDRRLHPSKRCNRNAHTTRTAHVVHQELRAGETNNRTYNQQKGEEPDRSHDDQTTRHVPRAHGYNSICVLVGTLPRCQRHCRRNTYALRRKHEEEV